MGYQSAQAIARHQAHYARAMVDTITVQRKTDARDAAQGLVSSYAPVTNLTTIAARVRPALMQPQERSANLTQVRQISDWLIDLQEFTTAIQPEDQVLQTNVTPNRTFEIVADRGSFNEGVYRQLVARLVA